MEDSDSQLTSSIWRNFVERTTITKRLGKKFKSGLRFIEDMNDLGRRLRWLVTFSLSIPSNDDLPQICRTQQSVEQKWKPFEIEIGLSIIIDTFVSKFASFPSVIRVVTLRFCRNGLLTLQNDQRQPQRSRTTWTRFPKDADDNAVTLTVSSTCRVGGRLACTTCQFRTLRVSSQLKTRLAITSHLTYEEGRQQQERHARRLQ
jgi:hypothetical protein